MEFLIELILDLALGASTYDKILKPIRYLLIILISLFYLSFVVFIEYLGISLLKDNLLNGILVIIIGLIVLLICILAFRKTYLKKVKKWFDSD